MARFSDRVPATLAPNRISRTLIEVAPRFDLTVSNPTAVGIAAPSGVLSALARPEGRCYRPDPRGLAAARRAVVAEFGRHGATVEARDVVLTASTSEAYAFLFKLLCEGGDAILVPTPSYPLFEHLARVECVRAVPYRLDPEDGWRIDFTHLARCDAGARAVVVVHPNNPTGSFVHPDDAAALARFCRERGCALIADEVFLDYPLDGGPGAGRSFAGTSECLTFTLGGLSKSACLPQVKLAWIAVSGPADEVAVALERLEFIADSFLSVSTPVQIAAAELIAAGATTRAAVHARCVHNLAALRHAAAAVPEVEPLPAGGGWSAVVRIPAIVAEEDLAVELAEHDSVAVQPGFYFDFPRDGYLVLSLLPPPDDFAVGTGRLLARIRSHVDRV